MYLDFKIGVVILNYNDSDTTIKLCQKIWYFNTIDKIVVVDNRSTDNSYKRLEMLCNDKIDVIQTDKNGGYSYGNNYGAFYLVDNYNVDVLFIANPDVDFEEIFIKKCSSHLKENSVQAITGIMLFDTGKVSIWYGRFRSIYEAMLDSTILLKHFFSKRSLSYAKRIGDLMMVDFLPGSLFAIKSDSFVKVNGFDENVFLYNEEEILAKRLLKCEYRVAIDTSISYKHLHSASIDKSLKRIEKLKRTFESREYFYRNYTESSNFELFLLKMFSWYGISIRRILYKILY